jgi:hypothetical protein
LWTVEDYRVSRHDPTVPMRIRPPSIGPYRLFLSSSNDPPLKRLRKRVETLVDDVINPQLLDEYPDSGVQLALEIWERTAPQQAHEGSVNDKFVEKAKNAQLTLVLLHDQLRPGTREELDAAIEASAEVSLLCFKPSATLSNYRRRQLRSDIKRYERLLLYGTLGSPQSDDAWIGLTRVLFAFTLAAIRASAQPGRPEPVVERRA